MTSPRETAQPDRVTFAGFLTPGDYALNADHTAVIIHRAARGPDPWWGQAHRTIRPFLRCVLPLPDGYAGLAVEEIAEEQSGRLSALAERFCPGAPLESWMLPLRDVGGLEFLLAPAEWAL